MSREILAIGTDTRPPVLFRGDYDQWRVRFLDFIDRQELGEEMMHSLNHGPRPFYVDKDGNNVNEGDLKPRSLMTQEEKDITKADKFAKSYILQAIPNDIYTTIDSHKDARSMFKEIQRQMQGTDQSAKIKKMNVICRFEEFKANEDEMLEQTYNRFCALLNELRKNNIHKENLEIDAKFLKNLKSSWRRYTSNIMQNQDIVNEDVHMIFEKLMQCEGEVLEIEKVEKGKGNTSHDPLALMARNEGKAQRQVNSPNFHQQASKGFHTQGKRNILHSFKDDGDSSFKASLEEFVTECEENEEESDSDNDDVQQLVALLSNMMQRKKFGRTNGQRYTTSNMTPRNTYSQNKFKQGPPQ